MTLSPIDAETTADVYTESEPIDPTLKKVGTLTLTIFAGIAALAFIPACGKKRRVNITSLITPYFSPPEFSDEPEIISQESRPLPPITNREQRAATVNYACPRCNANEQDIIEKIFQKATGKLTFSIICEMEFILKPKIADLHPFAFLLAAPKDQMKQIFIKTDQLGYFERKIANKKIDGVMAGISDSLNKELSKNNLIRFIPTFAQMMGKDPQVIEPLIQSRNWRELVSYLFDVTF